jgi:phosphoenolpyruvate synthase/pyruvate phosphate dikinase
MNNYVISLSSVAESLCHEIGGKARSLVRLLQAKFNVPDGFVVTSELQRVVFERHSISELIRQESNAIISDDIAVVSNAAKRVRNAILEVEFSDEELRLIREAIGLTEDKIVYAVRSSGGVEDGISESWAGQFDSFLDVRAEDVPTYIKHCWASMFGLRAIRYGSEALTGQDLPIFSVVVQKMIHGDYSGIAFSVDPVDGDKSHIRIESVSGIGAKVVGGQETPYSVVLGREDGLILKREFGNKSRTELVSPSILRELMEVILKIEALFNMPIDVEWTITGSEIYILQARPITASQKTRKKNEADSLPDILDYQMTFKVTGLGFMFADLLCHGFGYLHPLFICNQGEFLQYFTNERMEYAARFGHRWLSTPGGVKEYKQEFTAFHDKSFKHMKTLTEDISADSVQQFYEMVYQYFIRYSKMDFQFTNLTFLYAKENSVIAENLKSISAFKDVARVWVNAVSIDNDCLLNKLLSSLSERFAVSLQDMEHYKISELVDLFDEKTVSSDELELRKNASVAMSDGQTIRYFIGKSAKTFISRVKAIQEAQALADIIGQVANRGDEQYVSGIVRLINVDYGNLDQMEQEMASMNHGEILVSEFTAPELMAACQKAKAIITDLGGMLSHAAIVSREMGIPCIVGTEHASRSLKNGDKVKINLDLGTVEII